MKKNELVYREILLEAMERKNKSLTQLVLSKRLGISLSTVSNALKPLRKMGAVNVRLKSFEIADTRKILLYWASIRRLERDIIYAARATLAAVEIEKAMPSDVVFGAYSAYKFMFKQMPADYSEVYVYAGRLEEIRKRFPESKGPPNLFVLKKDFDKMTVAHLYADLWNIREWYAREFLKALEERIHGLLS